LRFGRSSLQSIHWIDCSCFRRTAPHPLDQTLFPRHKTRHENGYLHYLPEDYSLARSLAWPFSSPEKSKMRNAPARRW